MRYGEEETVLSVTDLLYSFKGAMYGRNFGHSLWIDWASLLNKEKQFD